MASTGIMLPTVRCQSCSRPLQPSSSRYFGALLRPYVNALATADWSVDFDALDLPDGLKRAVVVHKGELTPRYQFVRRFLAD